MTEAASMDLKPPPNRTRTRNASDASDFSLFETSDNAKPVLSSSYESANRKRLRSGSVSGRLRSASEYLEEKGLLDRQTKGIMKDLIIIGDEELQKAIDKYESGDPSRLEEMIQNGALQNRLPKDLDILGDLDMDFLTVDESSLFTGTTSHQQTDEDEDEAMDETAAHQLQQLHSSMISPDDEEEDYDEDIVGDLEFHDDYDHDRITSDSPTQELSEHERRMRSNSLYSALIKDPTGNAMEISSYGRWMDPDPSSAHSRNDTILPTPTNPEPAADAPVIKIRKKKGRRPKTANLESNLTRSMRDSEKKKKRPRKPKANQGEPEDAIVEEPVHILGRPRSWSDPQLTVSLDEDGLRNVERPDGWVGAYSPDSRKERIKHFLAKRNHRVWTKSVKYNVRKDFANSRLRVKGRFVKKEDETLMRELMSLT